MSSSCLDLRRSDAWYRNKFVARRAAQGFVKSERTGVERRAWRATRCPKSYLSCTRNGTVGPPPDCCVLQNRDVEMSAKIPRPWRRVRQLNDTQRASRRKNQTVAAGACFCSVSDERTSSSQQAQASSSLCIGQMRLRCEIRHSWYQEWMKSTPPYHLPLQFMTI